MGTKQHQGGSLGVYIVVAVLLGLVLVGGLYGLQRYNANKNVAASEETKKQESSKNEQKPAEKPDTKTDDKNKNNNPVASEDKTPAPSPSTDENKLPSSGENGSTAAELPVTGPAEVVSQLVAIGALSFAGVAFVGSAQHRWTSRGN